MEGETGMKKIYGITMVCIMGIIGFGLLAEAADQPRAYRKCKMCHKVHNDQWTITVGPGLKGIGKRASREYLEKSIMDPQGAFDAGGPEIESMKKWPKFKPQLVMPEVVKGLTDDECKILIEYLSTL